MATLEITKEEIKSEPKVYHQRFRLSSGFGNSSCGKRKNNFRISGRSHYAHLRCVI